MLGISAYLTIAVGLLLAVFKHPAMAVAGVLCMFGLEQWGQATTTFFSHHQTYTNLLIGGILVLGLSLQIARKGLGILKGYPSIGWLIFALFLYAFVSTQWVSRPDISMALWDSRWAYIVTMLVLAPLLITREDDLREASIALLLMGGTLSCLLLFFVKWEARRIVLDHGLGNPLAVAAMAGMVLLIAFLADPWPRSKVWQPLRWTLIALCLIVIVKSGSRGQLVGVFLVAILGWPITRGISNLKQFVILSLATLFLATVASLTIQEFSGEQFQTYGGRARWSEQSAQEDAMGRIHNALVLLRLAYSAPESIVFGLGNSAAYDPRVLGIYPHFVPLEVLAEEGLIGFFLYVLIVIALASTLLRSIRLTSPGSQQRTLLGGWGAITLFSFLLSLKQGSLLLNLEPFMLAIVLGRYELILRRQSIDQHEEELAHQDLELPSRHPFLFEEI